MSDGDIYKRRATGPNTYQCGCHWTRERSLGDVLRLCPMHKAHSDAMLVAYERKKNHGPDYD